MIWMRYKEEKIFLETLFWKQDVAEFLLSLCCTESIVARNGEFLSKRWWYWQAGWKVSQQPESGGGGRVAYCVLDARPCCRMIVWLGWMINVMLKGSEGKSWRTCPPMVTANKASLNMGLLKIHTKAEEDGHLFSLQHTHTHTFFFLSSLMSKHLHIAGYQWTFLQMCAFHLVSPKSSWPLETWETRRIFGVFWIIYNFLAFV